MIAALLFVALLLLTVALLGADVVTGLQAKRKLHLTLVACTVLSLAATIWSAERLGKQFDFDEAGVIVPIHLTLAKIATLAYLLPVATGIATLRSGAHRGKHRIAAFFTLALTVLTAVTGTWMILAAEPL